MYLAQCVDWCFCREPSIASQASDALSSSPANFSPQTSATFPQPVENRFQETEAAQEPATDTARSTPTGQESQPQQSGSATMDQQGGGDAPEIDRAVSGLTNSAASRASTPDPQHSSTGSPLRNSLRPEGSTLSRLMSLHLCPLLFRSYQENPKIVQYLTICSCIRDEGCRMPRLYLPRNLINAIKIHSTPAQQTGLCNVMRSTN